MNTAQETDENRKPLDEQGEQYSPLDDPDVLPSILRFMDRESIRSMQQTQKQWGGVTQPSGILPPCVDERVWENRTEQPCTFGRRWDFDPETIMRATLCAFDTVRNQPFQHITHPLMHPIHMYVRSGRGIDTFKDNEVVKCMLQHGYRIGVTLLYPPDESIPDPLPRVAGLTPERSLIVADVPMAGGNLLPNETRAKAQTIRFQGKRGTIHPHEFEGMPNLKELPPRMPELTDIKESAFSDCAGLRELGQMDALQTIGSEAFYDCNGLERVGDMRSLHTIENWAFYRCSRLRALGDMNALTTIESMAFLGCEWLTKLGDMNALTTIESYAFVMCTRLNRFHIPETMQSIMERAFEDCPLGEVTVASANFQFQCNDATLLSKLRGRGDVSISDDTTVTVSGNVVV